MLPAIAAVVAFLGLVARLILVTTARTVVYVGPRALRLAQGTLRVGRGIVVPTVKLGGQFLLGAAKYAGGAAAALWWQYDSMKKQAFHVAGGAAIGLADIWKDLTIQQQDILRNAINSGDYGKVQQLISDYKNKANTGPSAHTMDATERFELQFPGNTARATSEADVQRQMELQDREFAELVTRLFTDPQFILLLESVKKTEIENWVVHQRNQFPEDYQELFDQMKRFLISQEEIGTLIEDYTIQRNVYGYYTIQELFRRGQWNR
jgi:hypothetical protein